ncbi:MAG: hypothetical protein CMJ18_22320 [Phycisphaeraceae bacterium]|nr:hypothetical protein [Phycisphaeraceae bacterium]
MRSTIDGDCPSQPPHTGVREPCATAPKFEDPDLIGVVAAWPTLSPAIKAGIVAMIQAQREFKDSADSSS